MIKTPMTTTTTTTLTFILLLLVVLLLPFSDAFINTSPRGTAPPSSRSSSSSTRPHTSQNDNQEAEPSSSSSSSSPSLDNRIAAASPSSSPPPPSQPSQPSTSRAAASWGTFSRRGAMGFASALVPAILTTTGATAPLLTNPTPAQAAIEEFPWVTKGGLLDGVLPESVLVESLPLNNQAIKGMGQALSRINELRGLYILQGTEFCTDKGQVKADLSFVSAGNATASSTTAGAAAKGAGGAGAGGEGASEMSGEESLSTFRWSKIKGLAENVRAIYNREKDAFPYALAIRPNSTAESQQRRRTRFTNELKLLDEAIHNLENATMRENVADTLRYQEESLLHVGHLGELMVAKFPFSPPRNDEKKEDDYFNLPRLFGRAEVTVFFKEMEGSSSSNGGGGSSSSSSSSSSTTTGSSSGGTSTGDGSPRTGNITLIIDGFNAPISAGNFIDLCQRGFYNRLPLTSDKVRSGKKGENEIDLVVGGRYKTGFVDPITGKQRRVPLEIVRAETDGNRPFYGQARNTGLFTRAPPLLSFRTPRAIGLFHPEQDGNGANSEFFWLRQDARCVETAKGLDGKYSLIGYVVGSGRQDDLVPFLDGGWMIETVQVSWGYDHLVRSRVGFIDILLQGDD